MQDLSPGDLPLGLGMALAQNPAALRAFGAMNESEQRALISRAHNAHSKSEMQALVRALTL